MCLRFGLALEKQVEFALQPFDHNLYVIGEYELICKVLENLLTNVVNQAQQAGKVMLDSVPVDPNMLNQFQSTMPQVKEQMKAAGKDPVLLVPPQLRPLLARYARLFAPGLHVLSYNEVPDELELKIMGALS